MSIEDVIERMASMMNVEKKVAFDCPKCREYLPVVATFLLTDKKTVLIGTCVNPDCNTVGVQFDIVRVLGKLYGGIQ